MIAVCLIIQKNIYIVNICILGWLYDSLQSYAPGFYVAGGTISLSGLILFFIPMLERRNINRATMLEQI